MGEEDANLLTINEDMGSDVDIEINGDDVKTVLKAFKELREGVKKIIENETSD